MSKTVMLDSDSAAVARAIEHYAERKCERRVAAMIQEFLDCGRDRSSRTWDRSALDRLRKKYEAMTKEKHDDLGGVL